MIFNGITSQWVPWLATGFDWSDDNRALTFQIREGVRWSDGKPFTAEDVLFTARLLKQFPALDSGAFGSF